MRYAPMPWNRISASIRLIMAMFRLYAGMESSWGRMVKDILKKEFPESKKEIDAEMSDAALGQKILAIVMKQTQYNEDKAQDAIQRMLTYWTTGTRRLDSAEDQQAAYEEKLAEWEEDQKSGKNKKKDGTKKEKPVPPKVPKPVVFRDNQGGTGNKTWRQTLNSMFSNFRREALTNSMSYTKDEKQERSIDQAFGVRGEDGGAKDGGEARMPTPDDQTYGKALDDKAGIKEFVDLIDRALPDLKEFMGDRGDDQLKLFSLVFDDDVGSFGSDIQENMNQATAMKEKYPELFEKNSKRWSGYIGDLRKKVLAGIWEFVEEYLTEDEFGALHDTFFSDTTHKDVNREEKKKIQEDLDYQRGLDERKIAKWKWQEQEGTLSDKDKAAMATLKKNMTTRFKSDGPVDFDAIPATEDPVAKDWKLYSKKSEKKTASFSLDAVASRVARSFSRIGA